ncbi:MAG: hypothetical protein HRU78_06780 [Gammaproteobacteria bacterium]|nr:MAG: hypothetical protein HRU78_06780 [Gammaproteobacteria bacterium]
MLLKFTSGFEGKPETELTVVAYVFDQRGALIASAPVKKNQVQIEIKEDVQRPARLFFASPSPSLDASRDKSVTLDDMERIRAYEAMWSFDPKRSDYELLPIPEINWKWWLWCACRVRGTVVRPVVIAGEHHEMPVCHARVHVCEVDRLYLLIPRLPDDIIRRIRDELLELIEIPIPRPPEPDPPPFRFDAAIRDISARNIAKMQAVSVTQNASLLKPGAKVTLNPQPLPPKAASMDIPFALKSGLTSASVTIIRQALLDHHVLIRPYLCYWPWLWPYFYRCDEVAVLDTDSQGRFDTTIWYLCAGDHPDLYFWVEYSIGGVWTTVYHSPIRCNTYWDYVCGSEVTLRVTDPRVPWCGDPNPLPGKQVAVMLIGNGVSMPEIQRASAAADEGLTVAGEPFGGSLEPHVWFGDALISSGITHYRWSYRRLTLADGVTASVGAWHAMDKDVVRHYAEILADSTLAFKPYLLGPDPAFAGQNLFKIRPVSPPLNPGAVSSSWAPEVDARENTASAFFLSYLLEGGNPDTAAGKYELKLELFKSDGSLVNLSTEGVLLKVPTGAGPFGPGTVATELVAHSPAQIGDMEDRVIRDGSGKIVAFRLVLRIDNNRCEAEIYPVSVDGHTVDGCGFTQYHDKTSSNAAVSFKARHPNNFATFSFTIARGSMGIVETAGGPVGSNPSTVGGYARNPSSVFSKNVPVADLLGDCSKAAFAENLHVDALATDGWSTLDYLDANATPVAFALEPEPPAD